MAKQKKESRIKVEDLPEPEQGLTAKEAKGVSGGADTPQSAATARNMDNILNSGSPGDSAEQMANAFGYAPASVPLSSTQVKQTK